MRKTTKNHGLTGAVITVIVLVLLMVLSAGAMLGDYFGSGGGGFEAGVIILCALLCLAVAVFEGEFAGALLGTVGGLLWDCTAGRTVGMLALELLLLCFAVSVLVQLYLQVNPGNFAAVSTATALVVLSLDWLFFYYMPGYTGAALRYVTFVLPGAVLTIPAALLAFWLVQHIHDGFRIDNGVV